jgi:hypothetical protein
MPFFVKNAKFKLCFNYKRLSNPPDGFGVDLIVELMVEFCISCDGIFPLAGAVKRCGQKYYAKRVFPGVAGIFL